MKTKNIGLSLIFLFFFIFSSAFAQQNSSDRTYYSSCLDLTNQLQKYLKQHKNLTTNSGVQIDFREKEIAVSNEYMSLLNGKKLLILKGDYAKQSDLIARIHLPKSRADIQHHILDSNTLLVSARTETWSIILRYQINWKSIKKIKKLTFSSPVIAIRTMHQKILVLTKTFPSKTDLIQIAKNQKPQSLFTLDIDVDPKLGSGSSLSPTCKQLQYGLLSEKSPQLLTISIFDQDAIDKTPEINYYLWDVEQIFFGQDYIFFANNLKNQEINCKDCIHTASWGHIVLIQKHTLEPRLHQSEKALLNWELLTMKPKSANTPLFLLSQKSGNIKQYQIAFFDSKFSKIEKNEIIARSSEDFSQLLTNKKSLLLTNHDQSSLLSIPQTESTELIKKNKKSDLILHFPSEILILKTEKSENSFKITLINPNTWQTLWEKTVSHMPNSNLLRDTKNQLLSFFSTKDEKLVFHTYFISDQGDITHKFSRNYANFSQTPTFIWLNSIGNQVMIIQFREFLDIFNLQNPNETKIIKLIK